MRSARASRRSGSTTWRRSPRRWRAFGWHTLDRRRSRHRGDPRRRSTQARGTTGPSDDGPGADDQGKGDFVHRGQARVARQAAEEGRRARRRRSPSCSRSSSPRAMRRCHRVPAPKHDFDARRRAPGRRAAGASRRTTLGPERGDPRSVRRGAGPARRRRRSHRRARRRREELDFHREVREAARRRASTRRSSPSR